MRFFQYFNSSPASGGPSNNYYTYKGIDDDEGDEIPQDVAAIHFVPDVQDIHNFAFMGCHSIISIEIPLSVESIGMSAFNGCSSLQSINFSTAAASSTSSSPSSNLATIEYGAFFDCANLNSILIPLSVTSIGDFAFYGCKSLISIILPPSIKTIGKNVFQYCTSLQSVTIPDSVMLIDNYAFLDCKSLKSILIPPHTEIGPCSVFPDSTKVIRRNNWYHVGPCIVFRALTEGGRAKVPSVPVEDKELQIVQHFILHSNDDLFRETLEFIITRRKRDDQLEDSTFTS